MPEQPPQIKIVDQVNHLWPRFNKQQILSQRAHPLIGPQSTIFTMGSCFAVEIRRVLRSLGMRVVPDYHALRFAPEVVRLGNLPERDNINYYHTFAIRQEFERSLGLWQPDPNDYWQVRPDRRFGGEVCYQDPYRRAVFGRTPQHLADGLAQLTEAIRGGIESADVFLITLGLTEVWRQKTSGHFACMSPGYALGGGQDELEFHLSTVGENFENLKATVRLIRSVRPDAPIVFTVSPVPLTATFTQQDVFVANMESKSTLRVAAAEVCRSFEGVHYFPSYEVCTAIGDVYEADGRHIKRHVVQSIVKLFLAQFTSQAPDQEQRVPEPIAVEPDPFAGPRPSLTFAVTATDELLDKMRPSALRSKTAGAAKTSAA